MKVMVSVDMEGITGVCHKDQTLWEGKLGAEGIELMIGDINACVAGLAKAGVNEIVVWDGHWRSFNVPLARLHPAAVYRRGAGSNDTRWPELDESFDGLVLLGYHAQAGTLHGVLEHTMSPESWFCLTVNGREVGEAGMDGALAGAVGVPVILATGDDKLCAEVTALFEGQPVTVCVKYGHGRHCATCLPPEKTAALIRDGAAKAIEKIGHAKLLDLGSPAVVKLVFKHTDVADRADLRPFNGRRIDGYTVQWTCPDFASWMGFTARNPVAFGPG